MDFYKWKSMVALSHRQNLRVSAKDKNPQLSLYYYIL